MKLWVAKADAPEGVRRWLANQPRYKQEELERLKKEVASIEARRAGIARQPTATVQRPGAFGGTATETNTGEMARRRNEMTKLRGQGGKLKRQIKELEADTLKLYAPQKLEATLGSMGRLNFVRVVDVIDAESAIIQSVEEDGNMIDELYLRVDGFSTADWVDDKIVILDQWVMVGGKSDWAGRTVYKVGTCQPLDHIEQIEVPTTPLAARGETRFSP